MEAGKISCQCVLWSMLGAYNISVKFKILVNKRVELRNDYQG